MKTFRYLVALSLGVSLLMNIGRALYAQSMVLNLHESETGDEMLDGEVVVTPDGLPTTTANTIRIVFKIRPFSGEWLLSQPDEIDTPEERFVTKTHEMLSNLKDVSDYRSFTDDLTYDRRVEEYAEDPDSLEITAAAHQQFDDLRLLCGIAYGPYEMFMVQYAGQAYENPVSSTTAVIKTETGYLLSDGPGATGDYVFGMFLFGTLHNRIVSEMERHLGLR